MNTILVLSIRDSFPKLQQIVLSIGTFKYNLACYLPSTSIIENSVQNNDCSSVIDCCKRVCDSQKAS